MASWPSAREDDSTLTNDLLPHADKDRSFQRFSKAKFAAGTAVLSVLLITAAFIHIPHQSMNAARAQKSSNLRAAVAEHLLEKEDANFPSWYHFCDGNNPFCDQRRNVRDQLDYETRWAYEYMKTISKERLDEYLGFFHGIHQHILEIRTQRTQNKSFAQNCAQFLTWEETEAFWQKKGISATDDPRGVMNYALALEVGFKKASDTIHKLVAACSWNAGEPGWGAERSKVELTLKGGSALISQKIRHLDVKPKFMWVQLKGRGGNLDKVAIGLNIDRSLITDSMGQAFAAQLSEHMGETMADKALPSWRQRLLPGVVRWDSSFKNDNFGLFSYGDATGWADKPDVRHFFYDEDIHGFGVWGRNLTLGNPAMRYFYSGTPWIGGASGSLVDFYSASRALGYTGKKLADLMLCHATAMVAGGHHSLGELVIAGMEADRAGGGDLTFERDGKNFSYFAGPIFGKFLDIMNSYGSDWDDALKALAPDGGLPALYAAGLDEFIDRAGRPAGFERRKPTIKDSMKQGAENHPSLNQCLGLPGTEHFRRGLFELGGPKRALESWNFEALEQSKDGISPDMFVLKIGPACYPRHVVQAKAAFEIMTSESGTALLSRTMLESHITNTPSVNFLAPFKDQLIVSLSENERDLNQAQFIAVIESTINEQLLEVAQCLLANDDFDGARIDADAFEAFYNIAWLDGA